MIVAGTFALGTGAATRNDATAIAEDLDFSVGESGSTGTATLYSAFAQSGAVTFSTGTGAVTLNSDVAIASDKDLRMTGAGTFASGTGAVMLNGEQPSPMAQISPSAPRAAPALHRSTRPSPNPVRGLSPRAPVQSCSTAMSPSPPLSSSSPTLTSSAQATDSSVREL